jgi:hypothetical protein
MVTAIYLWQITDQSDQAKLCTWDSELEMNGSLLVNFK